MMKGQWAEEAQQRVERLQAEWRIRNQRLQRATGEARTGITLSMSVPY
jgi:hypothetical protein